MKLHFILAQAVVSALSDIFAHGRQADKVIERLLQSNRKWGARDRAFIAEQTYDMVRHWRLLHYLNDTCGAELPPPDSLAEPLLWRILGIRLLQLGHDLPPWREFEGLSAVSVAERLAAAQALPAVRESYPDWIYELCAAELGGQWEAEAAALNQPAPVVVRANTLKTRLPELRKALEAEGLDTSSLAGLPDALVLGRRANLFQTPPFREGWFEVQDAASQLVAPFLEVAPGQRVVDACAGAGGKSLHLAALMHNKGSIIAMDVAARKLEELRRRARRAGAGNIETRLIEGSKTIKRLEGSADRLLLDVPCTGLGVLRRNPDAKWKLQPEFYKSLLSTQRSILADYSRMLKPGGLMVYATCSILPSEGEMQVRYWLEHSAGAFELLGERRTSPAATGFDGFYMALLKKK